jgi:hypothetical protein
MIINKIENFLPNRFIITRCFSVTKIGKTAGERYKKTVKPYISRLLYFELMRLIRTFKCFLKLLVLLFFKRICSKIF